MFRIKIGRQVSLRINSESLFLFFNSHKKREEFQMKMINGTSR